MSCIFFFQKRRSLGLQNVVQNVHPPTLVSSGTPAVSRCRTTAWHSSKTVYVKREHHKLLRSNKGSSAYRRLLFK